MSSDKVTIITALLSAQVIVIHISRQGFTEKTSLFSAITYIRNRTVNVLDTEICLRDGVDRCSDPLLTLENKI